MNRKDQQYYLIIFSTITSSSHRFGICRLQMFSGWIYARSRSNIKLVHLENKLQMDWWMEWTQTTVDCRFALLLEKTGYSKHPIFINIWLWNTFQWDEASSGEESIIFLIISAISWLEWLDVTTPKSIWKKNKRRLYT